MIQTQLINIPKKQKEAVKKFNCLICTYIVTDPVECKDCKQILCRQCALKKHENNEPCPKGCSPIKIGELDEKIFKNI